MPKSNLVYRLDRLLVERGLVEDVDRAQRMVMAGQVRVDGQVLISPSAVLSPQVVITLESRPRYVSRGGEKLESAIQVFQLECHGRICADVGASTGGFTDCLLQHGAAKVYAIDVGEGILDWRLRRDPRVVVMEGTNARQVTGLPEPVSLVTIDASFISLKKLLPVVKHWFTYPDQAAADCQVVALIKPQFEAGRLQAARAKGVIRDASVHRQVLEAILGFALNEGYGVRGLARSALRGAKGNLEFLAQLAYPGETSVDLLPWLDQVSG